MQLGFFTMPIHPPSRSLTETLKEDRELVLLAEALEFTEGFIGEHITDGAENILKVAGTILQAEPVTLDIREGRVVDGADGAALVQHLRRMLEHPALIFM